jgi:hypothetical protein
MISAEYLAEQQKLHENPKYGVASTLFAPIVAQLIRDNRWESISDYGAGKQRLRETLEQLGVEVAYSAYDPVFPEYGSPRSADLVCCIDVLEHIEPEHLDAVLDDLQRIITGVGFLTIHTGAAKKVLSDGRNAHLIQKPSSFWLPRLCERFEVVHLTSLPENGFWLIVTGKALA